MLRIASITRLALFLLPGVLFAQVDAVPLLEGDFAGRKHMERSDLYWTLDAADDALKIGFSAVAERLYREALNSEELTAEERDSVRLRLASALISEARFGDAAITLEQYTQKEDPAYILRFALVDYRLGRIQSASDSLQTISVDELNTADKGWYYLLFGLLEEGSQNFEGAELYFDMAREASVSSVQRAEFEAILFRNRLFSGNADEDMATDLRSRVEQLAGRSAGFQFAMVYAVVLDQLDNTDRAIEVIEKQLQYETVKEGDYEDKLLLLLGLLAGEQTDQGRGALRNLLRKENGNPELQRIALHLLARQALTSSQTGAMVTFLNELIDRPTVHPLLDELYYFRAYLALHDNRIRAAEADARLLLDQFPGSPLAHSVLRLLAYLSWHRDPPQYRTAAGYLGQLRAGAAEDSEKVRLSILMADCYYLNGDFANAADIYGAALQEAGPDVALGTLLFQQVMAEIGAGRIEQAITHLDAAGEDDRIDIHNRWRAEWNLISKMKSGGRVDEAFLRVKTLLDESEKTAVVQPQLRLRLMWLEAQLSIDARQPEDTPALCDNILETLEEVPEGNIDQALRDQIISHTLLLKGQAYFEMTQTEQGLAIFAELRNRYPSTELNILSYLIEARFYAAIGRTVDAQQRLVRLADESPASKYAPIALWEAALNAEKRGLTSTYQESVTVLERLVNDYPGHPLVFYARLKQGDLLRELNDFGTAQLLYEELINQFPNHPERYRAEISRADCFLAQASQNRSRLEDAAAIYQRLIDLPDIPLDLRVEAGTKWGLSVAKRDNEARAEEVFMLVINRFLKDPATAAQLGAQGRYWQSRSIFELAALFEKEGRYEEARETYSLVEAYGLPGQSIARASLQRFSGLPDRAQ